jgi:hypothetical protein
MLARLEERRRLEAVADELNAELGALARAATEVRTSEQLLTAAYLVPRPGVDAFRGAVLELERRHPELAIACTGPWPAYSFAIADPPSG